MNCFKCGVKLDEGARFCGGCGSQQPDAVIPKAAVRSHARTVFQGSGGLTKDQVAEAVAKTMAAPGPVQVVKPPDALAKTAEGPAPSLPARKIETPPPAAAPARKVETPPRASVRSPAVPEPLPKSPAPEISQRRPSNTMPVDQLPPVPDDVDLSGRTLNNRYQVEAKIGEGGFGAVYRARQTQMNRLVALKVLHARMATDQQVIGRFKREAQASSLLRAPHTVQVYDFDQTPEGVMYLAMEMLTGQSLHSILRDEGGIEPIRATRILDGIAESLAEAHGQGIVHRDIKPENIFLEPRPSADFVKVLDFGIAKIVGGDPASQGPALTAAGQTLGTLEYMSPEQLMGQQLDGRSDLYACGILAYELLTGALPFACKTPGEMITAHLRTVPSPPSMAAPARKIPPLLDTIILKLLEKNRDARYADANALRADLQRVLAGETRALAAAAASSSQNVQRIGPPTSAKAAPAPTDRVRQSVPPGERVPSTKMATPTIILLVVLGVAVAAAVAGVVFWLTRASTG